VAEVGEAEEGEAVHIKSMEKIYENIWKYMKSSSTP
jgi:hypothetical protein